MLKNSISVTLKTYPVNISIMDIETYRKKQAEVQAQVSTIGRRLPCPRCLQPDFSCYCELLKPFAPKPIFVILIHPIEVARRIATGRMAHLCLKNSQLIIGHSYEQNQRVNSLIEDTQNQCVLLYPGPQSKNLSLMTEPEKIEMRTSQQQLVIFVIDGTWNTARKTLFHSPNLKQLPRIEFKPDRPSRFKVRKQPRAECYSTIEAIHQTIDLLGTSDQREHDHLLYVFEKMVARQIELAHSKTWSPWDSLGTSNF